MTRALVFDSGVGGLTIVESIRRAAPDWHVDFAADSGFFPYGLKTDAELKGRLPGLCARLTDIARPDVLVIACNTASTLSLEDIRASVRIPVVGTVPAIKPAAEQTRTGVIGLLATPGTVRRAYLDDLERRFAAGRIVIRHGSAGLVEIAERAVRGQPADQAQVAYAIQPLFAPPYGPRIDIVILACTHFPLIRAAISLACPPGVKLIDTGDAVARQAVHVAPRCVTIGKTVAYVTGGVVNRTAMQPALARFNFHSIEVVDL